MRVIHQCGLYTDNYGLDLSYALYALRFALDLDHFSKDCETIFLPKLISSTYFPGKRIISHLFSYIPKPKSIVRRLEQFVRDYKIPHQFSLYLEIDTVL